MAQTHTKSHWQVSTTGAFCGDDIIFESMDDEVNLESIQPDTLANYGATYYWRVRYFGSETGWSAWSEPTRFTATHYLNNSRVRYVGYVTQTTFANGLVIFPFDEITGTFGARIDNPIDGTLPSSTVYTGCFSPQGDAFFVSGVGANQLRAWAFDPDTGLFGAQYPQIVNGDLPTNPYIAPRFDRNHGIIWLSNLGAGSVEFDSGSGFGVSVVLTSAFGTAQYVNPFELSDWWIPSQGSNIQAVKIESGVRKASSDVIGFTNAASRATPVTVNASRTLAIVKANQANTTTNTSIRAYDWSDSSGFVAEREDLALPAIIQSTAASIGFLVADNQTYFVMASNAIIDGARLHAWEWDDATGIGSKLADPVGVPAGNPSSMLIAGDTAFVACALTASPVYAIRITQGAWELLDVSGAVVANPTTASLFLLRQPL